MKDEIHAFRSAAFMSTGIINMACVVFVRANGSCHAFGIAVDSSGRNV
jgi:hypothetical protein